MTFRIILAGVFGLALGSTVPAAAQCLGDFNGDFEVTVDELIVAVQNSLDNCELNGPRFVDNRDGTITDRKTGLVWEKKENADGLSNLKNPHDADNGYAWSNTGSVPDGTVFTTFLFELNGGTSADGVATAGCFTGHCDWRLPTIEELAGIADVTQVACGGGSGACIDPIFGATQVDAYWSATGFAADSTAVWVVNYGSGATDNRGKAGHVSARAVRGGV
jgi:hypothetical protein